MKVLHISQTDQRDLWLQQRIGKITGAKAKLVKPLSRGKDRVPQGFWQLLAEKVAVAPDGEPPIERGLRLENQALQLTADKLSLDIDLDPGMWISDENESLGFSPDGAEKSDKPTWSAEAKCLSTPNHLKYVIKDLHTRTQDGYSPIDSIPDERNDAFREQVIQAFVVNEHLQAHYFTLYDDRVAIDKYMHHVITIERKDIKDEIEAQRTMQMETLAEIDKILKELTNEQL